MVCGGLLGSWHLLGRDKSWNIPLRARAWRPELSNQEPRCSHLQRQCLIQGYGGHRCGRGWLQVCEDCSVSLWLGGWWCGMGYSSQDKDLESWALQLYLHFFLSLKDLWLSFDWKEKLSIFSNFFPIPSFEPWILEFGLLDVSQFLEGQNMFIKFLCNLWSYCCFNLVFQLRNSSFFLDFSDIFLLIDWFLLLTIMTGSFSEFQFSCWSYFWFFVHLITSLSSPWVDSPTLFLCLLDSHRWSKENTKSLSYILAVQFPLSTTEELWN